MTEGHIRGQVTRSTILSRETSRARPTIGAGQVVRADARAIGAITTSTIRASGDPMARMMRPNRGVSRKVTRSTLSAAELHRRRIAAGLSPIA
jgi:hypothetical protein